MLSNHYSSEDALNEMFQKIKDQLYKKPVTNDTITNDTITYPDDDDVIKYVDLCNSRGLTFATMKGVDFFSSCIILSDIDSIKYVLDNTDIDFDVPMISEFTDTPVSILIQLMLNDEREIDLKRDTEIIKLIINHSGDLRYRDYNGMTAYDHAKTRDDVTPKFLDLLKP